MGRTTKVLVASLVLLVLCALPQHAHACSFIRWPLESHFQLSDAIFVGEVTAVKHNINEIQTPQGGLLRGPGTIELTFKVIRVVKGELKIAEAVVVSTSDQESACGITEWARQRPGASWIVYAHRIGATLQAGISSPTKAADSVAAAEDLKYFDSLK